MATSRGRSGFLLASALRFWSPPLRCAQHLRQGLEQEQGRHRVTSTSSNNQSNSPARVVSHLIFSSDSAEVKTPLWIDGHTQHNGDPHDAARTHPSWKLWRDT